MGNDQKTYRTVKIGTQVWMAENLAETKYRNGDAIPEVTDNDQWATLDTITFDDWFLPSKDELALVYSELKAYGIGNIKDPNYWTSSEGDADRAWLFYGSGLNGISSKSLSGWCRPVHKFLSSNEYNLRDIGIAGGWIFRKEYTSEGLWEYYEAAPADIDMPSGGNDWSNIRGTIVGTTGTAVGTGLSNTNAIVSQLGHTRSAAQKCLDHKVYIISQKGMWCAYDNDHSNI